VQNIPNFILSLGSTSAVCNRNITLIKGQNAQPSPSPSPLTATTGTENNSCGALNVMVSRQRALPRKFFKIAPLVFAIPGSWAESRDWPRLNPGIMGLQKFVK